VLCSAYAFVFTWASLWIINLVTRVKVDEAAEQQGLDIALHGEEAYPVGI
jgi:Amt family ammonium transporter